LPIGWFTSAVTRRYSAVPVAAERLAKRCAVGCLETRLIAPPTLPRPFIVLSDPLTTSI
jgi:hypothetical protein